MIKCCRCGVEFHIDLNYKYGKIDLENGNYIQSMITHKGKTYYCCKDCDKIWDKFYSKKVDISTLADIYNKWNNWRNIFFNYFLKLKDVPDKETKHTFIFR
jgi:hypothetical protein